MEHCLRNERGERTASPSTPQCDITLYLALSFLSRPFLRVSRPPAYEPRVFFSLVRALALADFYVATRVQLNYLSRFHGAFAPRASAKDFRLHA